MAIPQTKYVNIISAVGGTSLVSQRDLMGRVFTSNALVPCNAVLEFTGIDAVANYFGESSDEYKFAAKYFAYVSRSGNIPQKISFALHTSTALGARLYGAPKSVKLSVLQTLTNASITFSIGGTSYELTGLDFSADTSFTAVALTIFAALNTAVEGFGNFEYNTTLSRFVLTTTATGSEATVGYASGDLAVLLGMNQGNNNAIISEGCSAMTALGALTASAELSNNFYSFTYLTTVTGEEEAIATWVKAQNIRYMWSLGVTTANASTMASLLADYDGVGLTLNEDCVFLPMAIAAAINYNYPNASVDFMYQQASGITPSVTTQADQEAYDAIRVNYYGTTQQAGQLISFYQDGKLQGSVSSMGVYVNEAWLKDALFTNILNLRMSLDSLPANETGLAYVKSSIQEVIEKAQNNGVISIGKELDSTQKTYVGQITGDKNAWQSVQSIGYWFTADIEKYTENSIEKYKVNYLLVYAKGDSINKVDGKDILI